MDTEITKCPDCGELLEDRGFRNLRTGEVSNFHKFCIKCGYNNLYENKQKGVENVRS